MLQTSIWPAIRVVCKCCKHWCGNAANKHMASHFLCMQLLCTFATCPHHSSFAPFCFDTAPFWTTCRLCVCDLHLIILILNRPKTLPSCCTDLIYLSSTLAVPIRSWLVNLDMKIRQTSLWLSYPIVALSNHTYSLSPQILLENGQASGVRLRPSNSSKNTKSIAEGQGSSGGEDTGTDGASSNGSASSSGGVLSRSAGGGLGGSSSGQILRAKKGVISNASVWWVLVFSCSIRKCDSELAQFATAVRMKVLVINCSIRKCDSELAQIATAVRMKVLVFNCSICKCDSELAQFARAVMLKLLAETFDCFCS